MTHKEPVRFNPYTGAARDARDIQSDPQGVLIVPPGAVKAGATNPTQAKSIGAAPVELPEPDGYIMDSLPDGGLEYKRGALELADALAFSTRPVYEVETVRAFLGAVQQAEVKREKTRMCCLVPLRTAPPVDAPPMPHRQAHPVDARMVSLDDVIARLEQGFGKGCAPATTLLHHFGATEWNA